MPTRPVVFLSRTARAYDPHGKHLGLAVNSMHMARSLAAVGVPTSVRTAFEYPDLVTVLESLPGDAIVVIEALWVVSENIEKLLARFPAIHFVVRCHSQVGFLQVEPAAVQLLRQQIELAETVDRFHVAANSQRLSHALEHVYRGRVHHLPNLYWSERAARKLSVPHTSKILRIGSFGALRLQKNHCTGALAALLTAHLRGNDLEFHINSGRDEGGGKAVLAAIRHLFTGVPGATLVEVPWSPWSGFRRVVSRMDLCVHLSASETFSLVTADALAEGVPCVVGPAIDWVPPSWIAPIDDPMAAARVAVALLGDPRAAELGLQSLENHVVSAQATWVKYLQTLPPPH